MEILTIEKFFDKHVKETRLRKTGISLPGAFEVMKLYGKYILDLAAESAMIEEHLFNEKEISIHSGGHICDEHYVEVNKDSILNLKKEIK